jgi:hypothetical protein
MAILVITRGEMLFGLTSGVGPAMLQKATEEFCERVPQKRMEKSKLFRGNPATAT